MEIISIEKFPQVSAEILGVNTDDMFATPGLLMAFIGFMIGCLVGSASGYGIAQVVDWETIEETLGISSAEEGQ